MFDLAKAMTLAYSEAIKKNPRIRPGTPFAIEFEDLNGNDVSMDVTYLGKGTWTKAYKTQNNDVILVVNENPHDGDPSKKMLADWNERYGETAHVPLVERIGCNAYDQDFKNCISGVYRVPLYKTFSAAFREEKDFPKKYDMLIMRLQNISERLREKTQPGWLGNMGASDYRKWSKKYREKLNDELASLPMPYGWEEKDRTEWQSIIGTIIQMIKFSFEYNIPYMVEFHAGNLAFDGNNQIILLDLFYDILSLQRNRGYSV